MAVAAAVDADHGHAQLAVWALGLGNVRRRDDGGRRGQRLCDKSTSCDSRHECSPKQVSLVRRQRLAERVGDRSSSLLPRELGVRENGKPIGYLLGRRNSNRLRRSHTSGGWFSFSGRPGLMSSLLSGPAKKSYPITASGEQCLRQWIENLRAYREGITALLKRHERRFNRSRSLPSFCLVARRVAGILFHFWPSPYLGELAVWKTTAS